MKRFGHLFSHVPLLGWLLGAAIAVSLEHFLGTSLALALGLPKIPVLFGFVIMLKKPVLIPGAILYVLLISNFSAFRRGSLWQSTWVSFMPPCICGPE
jgi:branched-chain amino acid transport system permease protein